VYAQNAPPRLPGRGGASIHDRSKKSARVDAASAENDAYASSTIWRPSSQLISSSLAATDALRS
jgi:hypothetical protein